MRVSIRKFIELTLLSAFAISASAATPYAIADRRGALNKRSPATETDTTSTAATVSTQAVVAETAPTTTASTTTTSTTTTSTTAASAAVKTQDAASTSKTSKSANNAAGNGSKSSSSSAALIPGSPAAIKREQDKLTEIVVKQDQVRDELIKAERLLRKRPGQYGKGGGSYRGGEDDSPKTKALKQKVIQLKAELRALRKDKKVAQARVKGQTALPLPKYKN